MFLTHYECVIGKARRSILFCTFRQGHPEVFDLIRKRKLYAELVEHLTLLMQLGTEVRKQLVCLATWRKPASISRECIVVSCQVIRVD